VERPDGYSWRPDGWSLVVQTGSSYVRTRAATNGRMVRILVRTHAICPLVSNAARIRTTLIHRPDGDPTCPIYRQSPLVLLTPPKSLFLASCESILVSFWTYLALSCLFAHYSHIPGTFLVETVRCDIFRDYNVIIFVYNFLKQSFFTAVIIFV
jgi:hypothetical protein